MELLETARVDAYSQGDVIIPASRRNQVLCVVWEGTCSEKLATDETNAATDPTLGVWHAGDWSGPAALQPDRKLNGESKTSATHDIVAVSYEGVKVITVEFSSLRTILMHGSALYKTYLERTPRERNTSKDKTALSASNSSDIPKTKDLNVLELLNCNSALRKLSAVQKRHVESLAEGPVIFQPYERMWQAGAAVDKAFIIVSGTASFHGRRSSNIGTASHDDRDHSASSDPLADSVRGDAMKLVKELDRAAQGHLNHDDVSDMSSVEMDENRQFPLELFGSNGHDAGITEANDFNKVIKGLQARADHLANDDSVSSSHGDEIHECEAESRLAPIFIEGDPGTVSRRSSVMKRRGSRARFANKVLGRLYNRRTFTSGLVFSRGHFLGDVSKMVAGFLASDETLRDDSDSEDGDGPSYGFGDKKDVDDDKKMGTITEMTHNGSHLTVHNSTLTAGTDGCVALVFPKSTLTPLLDEYPGLLLSLLGTQVVV